MADIFNLEKLEFFPRPKKTECVGTSELVTAKVLYALVM